MYPEFQFKNANKILSSASNIDCGVTILQNASLLFSLLKHVLDGKGLQTFLMTQQLYKNNINIKY